MDWPCQCRVRAGADHCRFCRRCEQCGHMQRRRAVEHAALPQLGRHRPFGPRAIVGIWIGTVVPGRRWRMGGWSGMLWGRWHGTITTVPAKAVLLLFFVICRWWCCGYCLRLLLWCRKLMLFHCWHHLFWCRHFWHFSVPKFIDLIKSFSRANGWINDNCKIR